MCIRDSINTLLWTLSTSKIWYQSYPKESVQRYMQMTCSSGAQRVCNHCKIQIAACPGQGCKWIDSWCVTINRGKIRAPLFTLATKANAGRLTFGDSPLKFEDQLTYHEYHLRQNYLETAYRGACGPPGTWNSGYLECFLGMPTRKLNVNK